MAVPAPTAPAGNAYTVHIARARASQEGPLVDFAVAAAPLLRRFKIPVRMHVAGDSPAITDLREKLAGAGARSSAFSPAPSNDVPGEGFWKTTLVVVSADDSNSNFWAEEREEKKVGWAPLMMALRSGGLPADLSPEALALPDLWCVTCHDSARSAAVETRDAFMRAGANAVVAVAALGSSSDIAWASRGAVFGRSSGTLEVVAASSLGAFSARIVAGIFNDLVGENLFDKTLVRADRECLEMRPLRLGRACGAPFNPASPWGSFGRKERHELHA